MEQIIQISLGCMLIVIGFFVKKHPNLIAGYNTMTKEEKKSFDIAGYSSLMKKVTIISGIVVIIGTQICEYFKWKLGAGFVIIVVGFSMCGVLISQGHKFRKKS